MQQSFSGNPLLLFGNDEAILLRFFGDTSEVIVNDILREDRRKNCEEIAHEARMSVASVYSVIKTI